MRLGRAGTEPLQARSAYGFRKALAWFGLTCGVLGMIAFGALAFGVGGFDAGADQAALLLWAGLFLLLALVAAVDLAVLRRRTQGRTRGRTHGR